MKKMVIFRRMSATMDVSTPTAAAQLSVVNKARAIHLITVILAAVCAFLPFSLSYSVIDGPEGSTLYEKIVTCNYLQAAPYDHTYYVPIAAAVLTIVLVATVGLSCFIQHRALCVASVVLSAASLAVVLSLIFLHGLERFTPTSLTMAYLLVCSLIMSIQQLTGKHFIDPTKDDEE